MAYRDLRAYLAALSEVAGRGSTSQAILFDRVKDYPPGFRVLVGMVESLKRAALTTNLPTDINRNEFIAAWKERLNNPTLIPPKYVDNGPVTENVYTGKEIDILKLPVPKWHERDGGRYVGTAHVVVTQDPEDGWVNLGV